MGGHSKKSGRGGGGGSSSRRQQQSQPKKLKKDPGVPDLKEVSRKLAATAQRKSHSVMSLRVGQREGEDDSGHSSSAVVGGRSIFPAGLSAGGRAAALRGSGAAERMGQVVARKLAQQQQQQGGVRNPFEQLVVPEVSEEERLANQRREMAALALRTSEKVHDYEAPLQLYRDGGDGDDNGDENDALLEEVDRRGTDKSLRRFFKEFNRVVESCDVLLQVLDARDPLGCRLTKLERSIRSSYGDENKKIVVVLNKVDMLPSKEVVDAWIHYFESREKLTCVPFAATAKGSAGQSYVHNMFRKLRAIARGDNQDGSGDRKAIVVGVIGYPNVGKSSIINALKRKNVVGVGNMPGFTTGNTEVELRSDIRVMDCPGVVMPGEDNGDVVLRGAVRVSDLANPFTPVLRLLQRCTAITDVNLDDDDDGDEDSNGEEESGKGSHRLANSGDTGTYRGAAGLRIHPLAQFYGIGSLPSDSDVMEFIRLVGLRRGRLTKGGQVDEEGTARMILDDWNSGRIAYYTYPPEEDDFFAGNDFRATRRGDGDANEEEAEDGVAARVGGSAHFVSSLSRGITMDGLPTFHLTMSKISAGKGSRKKWSKQYQEQGYEGGNDDDDDDEVL